MTLEMHRKPQTSETSDTPVDTRRYAYVILGTSRADKPGFSRVADHGIFIIVSPKPRSCNTSSLANSVNNWSHYYWSEIIIIIKTRNHIRYHSYIG